MAFLKIKVFIFDKCSNSTVPFGLANSSNGATGMWTLFWKWTIRKKKKKIFRFCFSVIVFCFFVQLYIFLNRFDFTRRFCTYSRSNTSSNNWHDIISIFYITTPVTLVLKEFEYAWLKFWFLLLFSCFFLIFQFNVQSSWKMLSHLSDVRND